MQDDPTDFYALPIRWSAKSATLLQGYTLNQWPKLLTYLQGRGLESNNNHSERATKSL